MPALVDLRRRIRSVRSTQQITRAMKMVASSRLRRAHDRVINARPFAREIDKVLGSLAARVDRTTHPLLAQRDDTRAGARALLIVVTADKGLCGAFNTNIVKEALRFVAARPTLAVSFALVGRKGRDFFRRRAVNVRQERVNIFHRLDFPEARAVATIAIDDFTSGAADAVYIVFNEFKSILQQRVVVRRLLPIERVALDPTAAAVDYLYEPDPQRIFDELLPRFVEVEIWQALLESAAAEYAARMTAMDSATRNAGEVIDSLTLYMNKVRQANITREIIEVVSGAEAL